MSAWIMMLLACDGAALDATSTDAEAPTYWRDAGPVLASHCAGCHTDGGIGTFALTTFDEAFAARTAIASAVETGRMPPWMPAEGCQDYVGDTSLSAEERDVLLRWVDAGAPEGDPADAPPAPAPPPPFEADVVLELPEPYEPVLTPDDYRCQLLDDVFDGPAYVTGLEVLPDRQDMVHHVIAFVIPASAVPTYQGFDDAEEGPGWTCFGGPTPTTSEGIDLETLLSAPPRSLGAWVPGSAQGDLPEGIGLPVAPGDRIVLQMHYNTSVAAPGADQSAVALKLADTVAQPATGVPLVDVRWLLGGMTLPAGQADVLHSTDVEVDGELFDLARASLGLSDGAPLEIHRVGHHMHTLGTSGLIEVVHADGAETCLLDLPRWDFSWQGMYTFEAPVVVRPGDRVRMTCTWDNSSGATDVGWGEGTNDEMCLGNLVVTAAE